MPWYRPVGYPLWYTREYVTPKRFSESANPWDAFRVPHVEATGGSSLSFPNLKAETAIAESSRIIITK